MAEPKSLEEAMVAYEANKFSRKSLFRFVVDRLKAAEDRVTVLEEQQRQFVSALVRGVQDKPVESPQAIRADYDALASLRSEAAEIWEIKVDKRWSAQTLVDKIEAARASYDAARGVGEMAAHG